jgi:hypothetical protein
MARFGVAVDSTTGGSWNPKTSSLAFAMPWQPQKTAGDSAQFSKSKSSGKRASDRPRFFLLLGILDEIRFELVRREFRLLSP